MLTSNTRRTEQSKIQRTQLLGRNNMLHHISPSSMNIRSPGMPCIPWNLSLSLVYFFAFGVFDIKIGISDQYFYETIFVCHSWSIPIDEVRISKVGLKLPPPPQLPHNDQILCWLFKPPPNPSVRLSIHPIQSCLWVELCPIVLWILNSFSCSLKSFSIVVVRIFGCVDLEFRTKHGHKQTWGSLGLSPMPSSIIPNLILKYAI